MISNRITKRTRIICIICASVFFAAVGCKNPQDSKMLKKFGEYFRITDGKSMCSITGLFSKADDKASAKYLQLKKLANWALTDSQRRYGTRQGENLTENVPCSKENLVAYSIAEHIKPLNAGEGAFHMSIDTTGLTTMVYCYKPKTFEVCKKELESIAQNKSFKVTVYSAEQ